MNVVHFTDIIVSDGMANVLRINSIWHERKYLKNRRGTRIPDKFRYKIRSARHTNNTIMRKQYFTWKKGSKNIEK